MQETWRGVRPGRRTLHSACLLAGLVGLLLFQAGGVTHMKLDPGDYGPAGEVLAEQPTGPLPVPAKPLLRTG